MSLNKILASIVAVLAAIIFFFIPIFVIGQNPFSILGGLLASMLIGYLSFASVGSFMDMMDETKEKKDSEVPLVTSMGESERQLIMTARAKSKDLENAIKKVKIHTNGYELLQVFKDIVKEMERDQSDFQIVRTFVNVHIDTTISVIDQFAKNQDYATSQIIDEFQKTIDGLIPTYQGILKELRNNDLLGLQIEMDILKHQIRN